MLRAMRLLFLALLAVVLIALALANRDVVALRVLPPEAGQFLGVEWAVQLPLFLVIFAGIMLGLLIGFVWEWLREARLRRDGARATRKVTRLEREMDKLRHENKAPQDDVLAILEQPSR